MAKPTDKQILDRAHLLLEQNGKPDGREDEFWYQAERQFRLKTALLYALQGFTVGMGHETEMD